MWHHFLYTPAVCWIRCFGFPDSQPVDKVEAQVTAAHTPLRPLDEWDLQSYEVMLFNATTMRSVLKKMQIRVQNIMIIESHNADGSSYISTTILFQWPLNKKCGNFAYFSTKRNIMVASKEGNCLSNKQEMRDCLFCQLPRSQPIPHYGGLNPEKDSSFWVQWDG